MVAVREVVVPLAVYRVAIPGLPMPAHRPGYLDVRISLTRKLTFFSTSTFYGRVDTVGWMKQYIDNAAVEEVLTQNA